MRRRRRHKVFSPLMETDSNRARRPGLKMQAHFLLMFAVDSVGPQGGRRRRMAKNPDNLAGNFETENTGGLMSGFLADEDEFDRRSLWRLGSWGVASVCAVILALYANQSSIGLRREQVAAADLARQAQQIQLVAKESQNETRRLASAIDTLNGDRDRLYTRVTVLEQGLDSVTGSIARQNAVAATPQAVAAPAPATEPQSAPQPPPPAPVAAPVAATQTPPPEKPQASATATDPSPATVSSVAPAAASLPAVTPAAPLMESKSIMGPPDPAAAKLIAPEAPAKKNISASPMPEVIASAPPADDAEHDAVPPPPTKLVQRTEFAVDVGGANSLDGLRALWRGLLKSRSNAALTTLRPIIAIKEGKNGLGMQLRLVAGPLSDAAAAAKICAGLIENEHPCETTVFDGQRLAMKANELPAAGKSAETKPAETKPADAKPAETKPVAAKPYSRRRGTRHVVTEEPAPAKKPESSSMLSSFFVRR
jgi:hypothetical protein